MIKLKEVIGQLKEENYLEIESSLVKSKADKFLYLLQSYKLSTITDAEIKRNLGISSNAFFVLKSRLFDKIQEKLACNILINQEKSFEVIQKIPEYCLNTPRETSIAYLLKLEKDLLPFNMHNELLVVYSALKKLHINSDKYYHYSQVYNKQVSYGLSLEKAEDLLGDFCRILGQYDFSRSTEDYEKLCFIKKEVDNLYTFCGSMQIELIKNLISLQLIVFCKETPDSEFNFNEILKRARTIFEELPLTSIYKKWEIVLDYISFEYYYTLGSNHEATHYYKKVNSHLSNLLLYNNIGLVSKFLMTKLRFCVNTNRIIEIADVIDLDTFHYDKNDNHSKINLYLYNAMVFFNQKKYSQAVNCLLIINNEFVFKDYFHQYLNIKLTLIYFYIVTGELEKAEICLKSVSRRIKEEDKDYTHVSYLLKAFHISINKEPNSKNGVRQKELYILFLACNKNNKLEVLSHLQYQFQKTS